MAGKYRGPIAKHMLDNPGTTFTSRQMADALGLNPTYTADVLCLLAKDKFCTSTMKSSPEHGGRHALYSLNPERPMLAVERYVSGASRDRRAEYRREYMRQYQRRKAGISPERAELLDQRLTAALNGEPLPALPSKKVLNGLPEARKRAPGVGKAITIAPRDDSVLPADERPVETYEQFLARGGQPEVLPHKFDDRQSTYPGRRAESPRRFNLTFAN